MTDTMTAHLEAVAEDERIAQAFAEQTDTRRDTMEQIQKVTINPQAARDKLKNQTLGSRLILPAPSVDKLITSSQADTRRDTMTYAELWETSYAIGYHRGMMRAERNMEAISTDVDAFDTLLATIPGYWRDTAIDRHNQGITDGDYPTQPYKPRRWAYLQI